MTCAWYCTQVQQACMVIPMRNHACAVTDALPTSIHVNLWHINITCQCYMYSISKGINLTAVPLSLTSAPCFRSALTSSSAPLMHALKNRLASCNITDQICNVKQHIGGVFHFVLLYCANNIAACPIVCNIGQHSYLSQQGYL